MTLSIFPCITKMGNCIPLLKVPETSSKLQRLSHSNTQLPSQLCVNQPSALCHPASFQETSNTEETFFDSHPWIDSDCEDDFFSVNGDGTPSLSQSGEEVNKTTPNKLLIELFKESFGRDENQNLECQKQGDSEITSCKKARQGAEWCLPIPNVVRSLSFSQRKTTLTPT